MAFYYHKPKIKKDEFQRKANEILAEHPEYEPIEVPNLLHHAICSSWWGQSWCRNLERYAFLADRITLGRNYVRNGAVINLKINGGNIDALVLGHLNEPHDVKIKIAPISPERQKEIEALASGHIHNLEEITSGNFPEGLKEIFFQKGILFPRPDEIDFSCSCSDLADLCRHTAAALYGIGVRLDKNPLYFFEMRGIDVKEFISNVVNGKIEQMLANVETDSYRILKDVNLMEVFGLEVPITVALPEATSAPVDEAKTASAGLQGNEGKGINEINEIQNVKTKAKLKGFKEFTWEESVALFNLIKDIGIGKAAAEFGTTYQTAQKIRGKVLLRILHDQSEQTEQTETELKQEATPIKHKKVFIKQEAPKHEEQTRSEINPQVQEKQGVQEKQKTTPVSDGVDRLNEELTRLKIENAILKGRLAVLLRQINSFKTAIDHLL